MCRRVVARVARRVDNHRSVPLCLRVPGDWRKTRASEEKTRRLGARGNGVVNERSTKREEDATRRDANERLTRRDDDAGDGRVDVGAVVARRGGEAVRAL